MTPTFADFAKAFAEMTTVLGLNAGKHTRGRVGQADKAVAKRRAANKAAGRARRQARR